MIRAVVGPDRFELSTPRLSSVCSNQLSYGPSPAAAARLPPFTFAKGEARSATGLVLSNSSRRSRRARVTEKRNEDGGEPHNALEVSEASELVQVDCEDLLSQMSYAIDP